MEIRHILHHHPALSARGRGSFRLKLEHFSAVDCVLYSFLFRTCVAVFDLNLHLAGDGRCNGSAGKC